MEESGFECSECETTFRKVKHLKYHKETVHSSERTYKCEECGNTYKRGSHLRRHVQNSHSPLQLKCTWEDCDKMFRGQEQLRKHLKRHEVKGCFPCTLCGKSFGKKRQLEAHVEKTHGPFTCVICGDKYTSRCEYRLHMSTQHPEDIPQELPCPYCEDKANIFPSEKALRDHIRSAHVKFPCDLCKSTFSRERDLRHHHNLKHTEIEIVGFGCEICGLKFSSSSNLRVHQKTAHLKIRDFQCVLCHQSFAYKHVLTRHMQTIHGNVESSEDDKASDPSPVIRPIALPELRTWVIESKTEPDS